ncbi:hypothetical protein HDF16_005967 [Granulicella aggregans]|uniref:Uncharacterized protein n=1 Tax=Granulicella aggregans TaxID=474949 RepID=A0A7W8E714_9BACT|nr:hypothetical protein [Granulicella aggregans]MBB5061231.1 hypothetical protein [Granulicella aggregans]
MIVVGAHYLPFMFSYGMNHSGALAAVLIGSGMVLAMRVPNRPLVGAWTTAVVLLVLAFVGRHAALAEAG